MGMRTLGVGGPPFWSQYFPPFFDSTLDRRGIAGFREWGAVSQMRNIWLEVGSLLSESVKSVAYVKEPSRGKEGISDYGQAEARKRGDPEDARGQTQIRRDLIERSPQHNEAGQQDPGREGHYRIHNFQRGRQPCRRIVGSGDVTRPVDVIRGC